MHEAFDYETLFNDIALLKLQFPVDFASSHNKIAPVCLPQSNTNSYEGSDAIVTGWGFTSYC